ncbi:MAG: VOC family protein [Acidobacteria bacterium]|nr:VOC family protein [Acidobacteriota bacterium]
MNIEISSLTPLLQIFNMRRSLAFYRDLLGFSVVADSGGGDDASWVWLRKDGCDLMLNDQYEPGSVPAEPPAARTVWHSDTTLFFGCESVDEIFDHFRQKGIDLAPPTNAPYGMRQLSLTDPDGYSLCFQHPVR